MRGLKMPPVKYELIKLSGGLDQVTPTLSLAPGVARRAANFEASITGGYTRIAGYERFDGRPNPSDARYSIITGTIVAAVSVGDTVLSSSTGVTAKVIAVNEDNIVVTRATGFFVVGEYLSVSGTTVMQIDEITVDADGKKDAEYLLLAANDSRSDIEAVPGSGPIRGVAYFNDNVIAWRDAEDGLSVGMWKSSPSGWVSVNLGNKLFIQNGSASPKNKTIVGATSGATALVNHVVVTDGDWATSDAVAMCNYFTTTGTFTVGENITVDGVVVGKIKTAGAAIVLEPGGRVTTVISNFGGYSESPSLYGSDGVNLAFEYYADGRYVEIMTGMEPTAPTLIAAHKNHLFLTYGSSLQHSAPGSPHNWDPVSGAGEISLGSDITEMLIQPGDQATGAMSVYTRQDTYILYGTGSDNWNMTPYNVGTGAIKYTGQNMSASYVLDDRGVISLATSLNYGNFDSATITLNIRPFIQQRRNLAVGSCVNREKSQYRLFFSDNSALYITIANGNVLGAMPIVFPVAATCIIEGEKPDGSETSFFGADNGFVYRLDVGGSFDGAPIPANISLVYNSISAPRVLKRYRKASVEITGESYAEIGVGYDLGYRSLYIDQPFDYVTESDLRSSYWDAFTWDRFVWDGADVTPSEIEVNGTAENISIRVSSVSNLYQPFTVNNIILHYTPRRGLR